MNYEEILADLQEYFANLIILQYRYAPENRALIKNLVNLIFANNLALQIRDLTVDVEKSVGAQLDVVGKWVGVDRFYGGDLWERPYLSYPYYKTIQDSSYNENQGGLSTFLTFDDNNGGVLTYKDWQDIRTHVNQMGDDYFRQLIKLKIIKNSINHTCKNIDDAIFYWSGGTADADGNAITQGSVYTTWGVMELTYHYTSEYKTIMTIAQYKGALPCPTGCKLILEEIS